MLKGAVVRALNKIVAFVATKNSAKAKAFYQERGQPGWKLPEGAEITNVDGGIRKTHVVYENVSLTMYGKADNQKYVAALV